MKLTVKTLKGAKFDIQVEETATIGQTKQAIEQQNGDIPAATTKLIHSGKVLADDAQTLAQAGIQPNDFLVVMVSKKSTTNTTTAAKKKEEPKQEPSPAVEPTVVASPPPAAAAATSTTTSTAQPPTSSNPPPENLPEDAVQSLIAMGFPEAEVRHCLRVARGNPDIAVEFLTNGIPDAATAAAVGMPSPSTAGASSASSLQSLRNHPQFDQLRRLVQTNPQMLPQVLGEIGRQQPELLQEINDNQALFLQMMNEPIVPSEATTSPTTRNSHPAQMAQMIQSMPQDQLNQMAQMMGLSVDQLRQTAQMIGSMPPEQMEQMMGGGGGAAQVLRLTEEEMAAVDRLAEMGFDRSEAAQAFLACDKDEGMAANLLMDSMMGGGGGGGAFGFEDGDEDDADTHNDDDNNDGNDNMQE